MILAQPVVEHNLFIAHLHNDIDYSWHP